MARRRRAEKREIDPDPKYQSPVLAKFINRVTFVNKYTNLQTGCMVEPLRSLTSKPVIKPNNSYSSLLVFWLSHFSANLFTADIIQESYAKINGEKPGTVDEQYA